MTPTQRTPFKFAKRYAVIFLAMAGLVLSFLYAAGKLGEPQSVTAQQFVDLQEGSQPHASFRRAHAKGLCLEGEFVASGLLAAYSTAEFLQAGVHPVIGRFSIAGANPTAPDLKAPVRSLALSFTSDSGQRWRTAMNTPTVMAVRTPQDFFEQIKVLTPDPATGKPDAANIKAFFAAHPESAAFNDWKKNYVASRSFATERYHSINAFYLVDAQGKRHAVRWAAVPQAKAQPQAQDISQAQPDALQQEIVQRLAQEGSIKFDLMVSFATANDDENNATIAWPADRQTLNAGTIIIQSLQNQNEGRCQGINFDPLVLPKGILPTADPILNARGAVYAESQRRRAQETFLKNPSVGAQP